MTKSLDLKRYVSCLRDYLHNHSESALYEASLMSQQFVEDRVGPEEIVAVHVEALEQATNDFTYRERAHAATDGLQFLLEVMIAYGVRHKEHLEVRLDELARSEADKAEVLAAIAHELRTPITAARGNLDLASRWLQQGQVERLPPLLGRSRDAVDRLARLTHDLLAATRGELTPLQVEATGLHVVVAQACEWAGPAAAEKNVAVAHETADQVAWVLADTDALLSVFGNLLSNAIRYTPPGGHVTVRHGSDGTSGWVEVQDNGIGMSPEVQARAFEKFYRAPEATAIEPQGLGLGLALVKQLVDAQGGRLEVESAPGRGSTFRVLLPCPPSSDGGAGA
jgi:signal transduction histidine kinase